MSYKRTLRPDEAALQALQSLYEGRGYLNYKMSKFEEYSLYSDNKSFLQSEQIITFTDGGRLMALKPDVTLSIAKNADVTDPRTQKLYYVENVYRKRDSGSEFSEIMQIGLESMGDIDLYRTCEVVSLAKRSLQSLGSYVLDLSHIGVLSSLLDGVDGEQRAEIFACISKKAIYMLPSLCESYGITKEQTDTLCAVANLSGDAETVIKKARTLTDNKGALEALNELEGVCGCVGGLNIDFSALCDEGYYNGIIFRGYLEGVPRPVLSGGRYDPLMRKLGKNCGAIGFAVYLCELDRLDRGEPQPDADVLLIYSGKTPADVILKETERLVNEGKSVRVSKCGEEGIICKEVMNI